MYTLLDRLGARYYAYQVLQSLFGTPPTKAQNDVLLATATDAAFTAVETGRSDAIGAWSNLRSFADAHPFDESRADEYTACFIGPTKLKAHPWESVYTSARHMLMQPSTLDVRRAYVARGFVSCGYPHEADDHVAIELDFMGKMALELYDDVDAGDWQSAQKCLADSRWFLSNHLLNWVGRYTEDLQVVGSDFFALAAVVLASFLEADAALLADAESFWVANGQMAAVS